MSTVLTPVGISSITSIRLLSNLMGSSIALELVPGQVINMASDKLLFYDTVVDSNPNSTTYNLDKIESLVSNGILKDSTLSLINPTPQVKTVIGGTFVANVTPNKSIKITAKEYNQVSNHLEILPVVDENNTLLAIYYRDAEGISYSLNGGLSSILIDNSNLQYPDEITSMAVQIYDSVLTSKRILKLFVGTLREGIKCFTPGINLTYQQFTGLEHTLQNGKTDYYFKHSIVNGLDTIDNGFAPIYIVGILNFTTNNGCPLIAYSRVYQDSGQSNFRYYRKNLQSKAYTTEVINGVAKKQLVDLNTDWSILSLPELPTELLDITLSTDCLRYVGSGQISTKLIGIKYFSTTEAVVVNDFIMLSSTDSDISVTRLSQQAALPIQLRNEHYVTGLSYFKDPVSGTESIFVTTDSLVWRYTNQEWTIFISSIADLTTVQTRALSTGLTSMMQLINTNTIPTTYLTGLTGFSIANIPDVANDYTGYMGSNIGVIQYQFTCVGGELVVKDSTKLPAKQLRTDLFNSYSTVTVPSGTNILLSCGLKTSVPVRYDIDTDSNYLLYVPDNATSLANTTNGTTDTEYFGRSNYLVFNGSRIEDIVAFYNETTYSQFTYTPSDQFISESDLSTTTLKLKPVLETPIISTYYEEKFLQFLQIQKNLESGGWYGDSELYLYLNKAFGKYIQLYIDHTVIETITIEPYIFTLQGTSTYYVPVKASSEVLDGSITTYFVDDYIDEGYVTIQSE